MDYIPIEHKFIFFQRKITRKTTKKLIYFLFFNVFHFNDKFQALNVNSGEVHSRNKTNDCLSGFVATLNIAGNT